MPKTKYHDSDSYSFVLDFIQNKPPENLKYHISALNWNYIISFVKQHGIAGLVYKNTINHPVRKYFPGHFLDNIERTYYQTIKLNTLLIHHYNNLLKYLNSNNIPVIPLKGIFMVNTVYDNIGLRPMGDIDLLIKNENIDIVKKHLINSAYLTSINKRSKYIDDLRINHHIPPLFKDKITFEIHYRLCSYPEPYSSGIEEIWKRSINIQQKGKEFNILCVEDLIIYHCFHINKHLEAGKIRIGQFCDIPQILIKYKDKIDWERLYRFCRLYNLPGTVTQILHVCNYYFNLNIPGVYNQSSFTRQQKTSEKKFYKIICGMKLKSRSNTCILRNLKTIECFKDKIFYILFLILPPVEFMKGRYNIKKNYLAVFLYPYRFISGIFKLII